MQMHMHMLVIATLGVAVLISAGAMMLLTGGRCQSEKFDCSEGWPLECGGLPPLRIAVACHRFGLRWLATAHSTEASLRAPSGGKPPHSKGWFVRINHVL